MKIIKKGEDWCVPTFEDVMVECINCQSKLSIEAEDVEEEINGGINSAFFECPVCFKHNKLMGDVRVRYCNWVEYRNGKIREEANRKRSRGEYI